MEIYLIRHTTPQIEKNICYGQTDIPLAESFEEEWQRIKPRLPHAIDKLYTSPLSRCKQLSSKLSKHYGISAEEDARLMEMNFGRWEMKAWNDIDQLELSTWMNNYLNETCPEGESYKDVQRRLKSFIAEKLQQPLRYLIVTHGGVIKCFHGLIHNTDGMSLAIQYGEVYSFRGKVPI